MKLEPLSTDKLDRDESAAARAMELERHLCAGSTDPEPLPHRSSFCPLSGSLTTLVEVNLAPAHGPNVAPLPHVLRGSAPGTHGR